MGRMVGWHCEDCGAKEEFYSGGGFLSYNNPEVIERSAAGDYGPAMKALLGDGYPEGWTVVMENAFYHCPTCGGVIRGDTLWIEDGGGWFVYYAKPEPCPDCDEELAFQDDKVPMSHDELFARCKGCSESGCPKCGSKKVSADVALWD